MQQVSFSWHSTHRSAKCIFCHLCYGILGSAVLILAINVFSRRQYYSQDVDPNAKKEKKEKKKEKKKPEKLPKAKLPKDKVPRSLRGEYLLEPGQEIDFEDLTFASTKTIVSIPGMEPKEIEEGKYSFKFRATLRKSPSPEASSVAAGEDHTFTLQFTCEESPGYSYDFLHPPEMMGQTPALSPETKMTSPNFLAMADVGIDGKPWTTLTHLANQRAAIPPEDNGFPAPQFILNAGDNLYSKKSEKFKNQDVLVFDNFLSLNQRNINWVSPALQYSEEGTPLGFVGPGEAPLAHHFGYKLWGWRCSEHKAEPPEGEEPKFEWYFLVRGRSPPTTDRQ